MDPDGTTINGRHDHLDANRNFPSHRLSVALCDEGEPVREHSGIALTALLIRVKEKPGRMVGPAFMNG
jgi:hypothetical protein